MLKRYAHWLHLKWPAGTVEKLPESRENGATNIPGVYIAGDLTGVPLLKFSAHTGTRAVRALVADPVFKRSQSSVQYDLIIVGGGVSGVAAAIEAKQQGLRFIVFESNQPFSTIANFPKAKPIYTYPPEMKPDGELQFHGEVKEALFEEMERQRNQHGIKVVPKHIDRLERVGDEVRAHHGDTFTRARGAVVAIGRSGNYRKIGCPGEESEKVFNRLHDPKEFSGKKVLVVGGGDSALETAIALVDAGAMTTLSYRKTAFSRPKPGNVEKMAGIPQLLGTTVRSIEPSRVVLDTKTIDNDVVFTMIGREAPLDFFRRSGIKIRGEWGASTWLGLLGFLAFCVFLYTWKAGFLKIPQLGFIKDPGFYYSLAYTLCVTIFGIRRMVRRKTRYVKLQTITLMAFQVIPLFLLPYFILPYLARIGLFDSGAAKWFADEFFPNGEYWRAFGFILAWPLFIWNAFTEQPLWGWLVVSFIQTFVFIPLIVWRWGKGAYCGWICSCGALAETLGDAHRGKMPHGPKWNRLNLLGQAILVVALALLAARVLTWIYPSLGFLKGFYYGGLHYYYRIVDIGLAGILGVGLYFHFSGRTWCRFACPLAALMHIYARFSRFRIFAQKEKCISCNVCTSVCHQGIDIMNFANKGLPMEDPQCVRCSACVYSCPTDVLSFGTVGKLQ